MRNALKGVKLRDLVPKQQDVVVLEHNMSIGETLQVRRTSTRTKAPFGHIIATIPAKGYICTHLPIV